MALIEAKDGSGLKVYIDSDKEGTLQNPHTGLSNLRALLETLNLKLPILSNGRIPVDNSGTTQSVSASSLPLPNGASTSANQTTVINTLSGVNTSVGARSDAAATSGTVSIISLFKGLIQLFPSSLGTKGKDNSLSVVLAADQPKRSTFVTAISLSNISGDQVILTPSAGKSLQIFSIVLQNPTVLTQFSLKQGTVGQGQLLISGVLSIYDYAQEWSEPCGLSINKSFVVNLPSTGSLNGYVTWREE